MWACIGRTVAEMPHLPSIHAYREDSRYADTATGPGAYLNVQFPALDAKTMAVGAYVIFMAMNIIGVQIAASFELFVTLLAIAELLIFMGVVSPGFSMSNFLANGWAGQSEFSSAVIPGIIAVFMARATLGFVGDYMMSWVAHSVICTLREAMFNRLLSLPITRKPPGRR